MAQDDYYAVLGVSKNASQEELKKAYRKKAIENHPDRNSGDNAAEQRFKKINEAYSTLSDPKKRRIYDQYGAEAAQQSGAGHAGGGNYQQDFSFGDFFDEAFSGESIFDSFFRQAGGGGRGRSARQGADLRYELGISLEDSFFGKEMTIAVDKKTFCPACDGSGSKSKERTTCHDCKGSGQVRQSRGIFSINTTCPTCRGEGVLISNPCANCRGIGLVQASKQLKIKLPAGIDSGQSIRVSGEGEAGARGVQPGDLYITVRIDAHEIFEREKENLYCTVSIPLLQAVLGAQLKFSNIDKEQILLKIQPGTQPGATLRLKGKGMPRLNYRDRGDLFLKIDVEVPKKLSSQEKKLFEELYSLSSFSQTSTPLKSKKRKNFFGF